MVTTPEGPKGLYPDKTFVAHDVVPDALIYKIATPVGSIEGDAPVVRVPFVGDDMHIGFVPEGSDIAVANPDLDEVLVKTGKLAVIVRQSNESARHTDAATLVAESMAASVTRKANTALLTNPLPVAETDTAPAGLLVHEGIPLLEDMVDGNLDPIVKALTRVEANGGTPSAIVVDPSSWGSLRAMKTATGSALPLLGSPAEQATRQLFGVPVIVDSAMSVGTGLVVDKTQVIAATGDLSLATSSEVFFGSDSIARRVTWRLGWNVVRPSRLAKFRVKSAL